MVFRGALHARAGSGHASLVDFCNPGATCEHDPRIVRTPRTALPVARVCSFFFAGGSALPFGGVGQPGGIGPGAAQLDVTPSAWRPSKRSLACEGLAPTQIDPDTLGRVLVTSTRLEFRRRCRARGDIRRACYELANESAPKR